MTNPHDQRRKQWTRLSRAYTHLFRRALKWTILSYGFVVVYSVLYGSEPALVHRLGTTLAALASGFVLLSISVVVLAKLAATVNSWLDRRERADYG